MYDEALSILYHREIRGVKIIYQVNAGQGCPCRLAYIKHLPDAGIEASADVYHSNMHAF